MTIPEQFEIAFRSATPYEELRAVASALLAEGRTEQAVYDLFQEVRAQLRGESREAQEDLVMDVMDCLVGWCSPHQRLTSPPHRSANGSASPGQSPRPASGFEQALNNITRHDEKTAG